MTIRQDLVAPQFSGRAATTPLIDALRGGLGLVPFTRASARAPLPVDAFGLRGRGVFLPTERDAKHYGEVAEAAIAEGRAWTFCHVVRLATGEVHRVCEVAVWLPDGRGGGAIEGFIFDQDLSHATRFANGMARELVDTARENLDFDLGELPAAARARVQAADKALAELRALVDALP